MTIVSVQIYEIVSLLYNVKPINIIYLYPFMILKIQGCIQGTLWIEACATLVSQLTYSVHRLILGKLGKRKILQGVA